MYFVLFLLIKESWLLNNIRMISEGSCDTEDWRNEYLNSVF